MAAEGELLDSVSGSISERMFSSVNRWRCGALLEWCLFFPGVVRGSLSPWRLEIGDWRLEIWERWREETTGAPRRAGRGRDARGSPRPRYPAKKHELLWFWGGSTRQNSPTWNFVSPSGQDSSGPAGDAMPAARRRRPWRQGALVFRYLCLCPQASAPIRRDAPSFEMSHLFALFALPVLLIS